MSIRSDQLPFDLRALEIFLAVCERGAMASAARALNLTQPAVSQAIGDLEARTGTVLFDRRVRPLALTPAGGVMRQRAAALLAEARQIGPLLKEAEHGRVALVRVGLVDSLARLLSQPIAEYLRARAEAVHIQSGLTAAHAGALLTRNLDVFAGADDLSEVAGLQRFDLVREPYILLLPSGTSAPSTVAALGKLAQQLPLMRYSARSKTGIEIERHLRRLALDIPAGNEFDTPYAVTAMVASGHGFAVSTPLCLADSGELSPRVAAAPLPGPAFTRTLTLIARQHELGVLPASIANVCRRSLEDGAIAALRKGLPWLRREFFSVGG